MRERRKAKRLCVRLTLAEREELYARARARGVKVSVYVRGLVLPAKAADPLGFPQLITGHKPS